MENGEVYFVSLWRALTRQPSAHQIVAKEDIITFPLITNGREKNQALRQFKVQSIAKKMIQCVKHNEEFGFLFCSAKQALMFIKDGYLANLHVSLEHRIFISQSQ